MDDQRQSNKAFWWVMTLAAAIILALGSAGGANLLARQVALEDRLDAMVAQQSALDVRLSRIEGRLDAIYADTQLLRFSARRPSPASHVR